MSPLRGPGTNSPLGIWRTQVGFMRRFLVGLIKMRKWATPYQEILVHDRVTAGMILMDENWKDIPPHWITYFAVENCDAAAEDVKRLGGRLHIPPTEIPNIGKFSVCEDPQGAAFCVISMLNPDT